MPEKQPASALRESALGQGAEAANVRGEAQALLKALAGRVTDPESRRRADRVRKSLTTRDKDPLDDRAVERGFTEFLDGLGGAGNGLRLIEAYHAAFVGGFSGTDVATFIKALPRDSADNLSPHFAAKCLATGVAARDVAAACAMGLEKPATEKEWFSHSDMLREICALPGFRSLAALCDFKNGSSGIRVKIGKTEADPAASPNLFRGLLVFAKDAKSTPTDERGWQEVADRYSAAVAEYLADDPAPKAVIFLGARPAEDPAHADGRKRAFANAKPLAQDSADKLGARFIDVSDGGVKELLEKARDFARKHPKTPFLIQVALHGKPDGTARHALGNLTTQDFKDLAAISPAATLQVDGCYAGASLPDAGPGTLLLGSSQSDAYASFQKEVNAALEESGNDLDGKGGIGLREARLAVFLRWRKSFLPTSFTPSGKAPVRLAAQDRSPDAAQA